MLFIVPIDEVELTELFITSLIGLLFLCVNHSFKVSKLLNRVHVLVSLSVTYHEYRKKRVNDTLKCLYTSRLFIFYILQFRVIYSYHRINAF